MKKILTYLVPAALFFGVVYTYTTLQRKSVRERENALKTINELKQYNRHLEKTLDTLWESAMIKDVQMERLEEKADSLANLATLPMPCEHELELKKQEVDAVRGALAKCKESKAIQTARAGLAEIMVTNQVELCDAIRTIDVKDYREAKRRAFFRGMGTGGLVVGILIILAL